MNIVKMLYGFAVSLLLFSCWYINQPNEHYIFQMHDDYVYPAAVHDLRERGEMHWAGGKPGIALLAYISGAQTPYEMLFFYLVFGLLTIVFLYLLLNFRIQPFFCGQVRLIFIIIQKHIILFVWLCIYLGFF